MQLLMYKRVRTIYHQKNDYKSAYEVNALQKSLGTFSNSSQHAFCITTDV